MYKVCYDIKVAGQVGCKVELFKSKSYGEAMEFYRKNKRKYRLMDRYLYIYKDEFILDQKTINECFEEGGE